MAVDMRRLLHNKVRPLSLVRQFSSSGLGVKNDQSYWMPFTDNRQFKQNPKVLERSEGTYFYTNDGRQLLDGMSGLWTCNAGHGQEAISKAIKDQADKMAFCASFNISHKLPFQAADELLSLLDDKRNFKQVFFTMCGSTAVDSALKIALSYFKSKGQAQKIRFIGREMGYHGVGFGGISVGGIMPNRKAFIGNSLPFVDHITHTHSKQHMAYSKGQPEWGAHLADDLEKLIQLHDPSTVAAVIIEPVQGSAGVIVPPIGYLERVREICTKHDVLLIFDEVITGFGRVGASFATERFDVTPDMITIAKGLTNGAVPQGAVICNEKLYRTIRDALPESGVNNSPQIELFHGYTYSGHPVAMAAALATMQVYKEQNIFERAAEMSSYWEERIHSLKGLPNIVDIRNIGMMGAVEFNPIPGLPFEVYNRCYDKGLLLRAISNVVPCAPQLTFTRAQIDQLVDTLGEAIVETAELPQFKP